MTRRVALTFDMESPGQAHWSPYSMSRILKALWDADVKATFFVQGRWAQVVPGEVRDVVEAGHLLGTHSQFHAPWSQMTMPGFWEDVEQSLEVVGSISGIDPRPWIRAPFGAITGDQIARLHARGLRHSRWSVDPGDWLPTSTPEGIINVVCDLVQQRNDSVVLLHTWPQATGSCAYRLIERLGEMGVEFVTVEGLTDASVDGVDRV